MSNSNPNPPNPNVRPPQANARVPLNVQQSVTWGTGPALAYQGTMASYNPVIGEYSHSITQLMGGEVSQVGYQVNKGLFNELQQQCVSGVDSGSTLASKCSVVLAAKTFENMVNTLGPTATTLFLAQPTMSETSATLMQLNTLANSQTVPQAMQRMRGPTPVAGTSDSRKAVQSMMLNTV